jgi:hypothetical protein
LGRIGPAHEIVSIGCTGPPSSHWSPGIGVSLNPVRDPFPQISYHVKGAYVGDAVTRRSSRHEFRGSSVTRRHSIASSPRIWGSECRYLPLRIGQKPLPDIAAGRCRLKPGDETCRLYPSDRYGVDVRTAVASVRTTSEVVVIAVDSELDNTSQARTRYPTLLDLSDEPLAPKINTPYARFILVHTYCPHSHAIRWTRCRLGAGSKDQGCRAR